MVQVLLNCVIYLFYFDICNFVIAKIASRIQALRTHSIGSPRSFPRTISIAECNELFRMTPNISLDQKDIYFVPVCAQERS